MASARKSTASAASAASVPWWKPPGLADVSDVVDRRHESYATPHGSAKNQRHDGNDATGTSAVRHASKLVERTLAYVVAPSSDTVAALYQLTRRATAQTVAFSTQHAALALRALDVLAEHVLMLTKPTLMTDTRSHGNGTTSGTTSVSASTSGTATLTGMKAAEVQQLLDVLYLFCKGTAIGYPSHALGKLLQWLTTSIVTSALQGACDNETLLRLQLLVVAEMLKTNAGVRLYVKEMKKVKELYRALTILLNSTEDAEFLVPCMAILARLVLHESLGAKLFSPKNVDQALELVFSVLEGTWDNGDGGAGSTSVPARLSDLLRHTPWLQCASVDLLCDLTDRTEILASLETQPRMEDLMDTMVGHIHLNGNATQIQVAVYFLSATVGLGHHFRKLMIKLLTDHDVFQRVLQVTLHPSKLIGTLTTELLLKVIGDDFRPFRGVFESSLQAQQLSPVVNGLFRLINEASVVVQQSETMQEVASSEEYLLSVHVCQLLTKLAEFPILRKLCVSAINLNQSSSVIQFEAAQVLSVDPQQFNQYQPRLSIQLVMLLSSLVQESAMDDSRRRTLNQFLQSTDVATILGVALFSRDDKDLVVETLLLFNQFIAQSSNKRFHALSLAEGIISVGQRLGEASDSQESTISSLEANVEAHAKTIERLQAEIQQALRTQDDVKARHDQELLNVKSKYMDQLKQKDDLQAKTQEIYEAKLREVNAQCESLAQVMNKKMGSLQHREQLLQENRAKRIVLEDENNELKRKVHVLEVRLEEIAQAHSITLEEMKIRDKEVKTLQDELTALSTDYTGQREEIERAQDTIKKLEDDLHDRSDSQENTFKELVLLSKAHKALIEEKDALMKEMDSMRDELSNMESLNVSIQSRLQEKKDIVDQLERKAKRFEESASIAQNSLEDERDKRRSAARDLDDLRKAHRKLESEAAMSEIRAAETHLLIESKEEHVRKCEEEIRHLANELKKHSKVQALIHQLSSGGDPQAVAASAFLARDS